MGKIFNAAVIVMAIAIGIALFNGNSYRLLSNESGQKGLLDIIFGDQAKSKFKTIQDYDDVYNKGDLENVETVSTYYDIATDFYEYGWATSFHFSHTFMNETFQDALVRHEERLAMAIGLKEGMKAIDCGSGVGGPARNIARFSKASVLGLSINAYQIERSRNHTRNEKMEHLVSFKQGDFTKMEGIEDESFDAAYAIEATCHAPRLEDVYGQVFRVLKPGALFGTYEWLSTPKHDPSNPEHAKAARDVEYGNGLPPLRTYQDVQKAALAVGFEIISEQDLVELEDNENGITRPWYHRMDMNYFSYYMTHVTCWVTETLGLAPKGTISTHRMLMHALDGLVAGGKQKTFTPMHLVVMRKPAN